MHFRKTRSHRKDSPARGHAKRTTNTPFRVDYAKFTHFWESPECPRQRKISSWPDRSRAGLADSQG